MSFPRQLNAKATAGVTLAALGVVYGDIGTSPLYAFKEAFSGAHALPITPENVLAVLSMMFWAVTLVVTVKYVTLMLRYDQRGEGGALVLLTFALRTARSRPRLAGAIGLVGAFAASLFYGDALITPAISVLSAVEGLSVATPRFEQWVLPIAVVLITGLFVVQRRGTARVGRLFGPIMVLWFGVLAALGAASIVQTPAVLDALNPLHALRFMAERPGVALLALGAVFLCVTGAEALYADMGHFGKVPIRIAWYTVVFPALMLNYFGQGALVLRDPEAARNPFYLLAPEPLLLPMVVLATCATIIASQATISAAYSVTQQASRLNFLPRLRVLHTSDIAQGQIYVPLVNWLMLLGVVSLVLGFGSSSALAGAYGIAVNGDMIISTLLLTVVVIGQPRRTKFAMLAALLLFLALEAVFLSSNLAKIAAGGWFPLVLGLALFSVLSTWRRGVELLQARKSAQPEARPAAVRASLASALRVPRTGVFFSSRHTGYPSAFLHNLKHNMVVHERLIFVCIDFVDEPYVDDAERLDIERVDTGVWRLTARFGFREDPNIEKILELAALRGLAIDVETTSFFTSKAEVVSVTKPRGLGLRRKLFVWMLQNSPNVADYLGLPPHRVVELRTQVGV
ncbi:MAG: potassium transporter Kup [Burkholderiales bacterium]